MGFSFNKRNFKTCRWSTFTTVSSKVWIVIKKTFAKGKPQVNVGENKVVFASQSYILTHIFRGDIKKKNKRTIVFFLEKILAFQI